MSEKWFVYWVTGSFAQGDRLAGLSEFATEEEARAEMADIGREHTESIVTLIRGAIEDTNQSP